MTSPQDLDELLALARDAAPGERIEYRDRIAAHGEAAVDAMTDWLGDPRLSAFAVRVLGRIGQDASLRPAVAGVLEAVDRADVAEPIARDVVATLAQLVGLGGVVRARPAARGGRSGSGAPRPIGRTGVAGRHYWVMRTSQWERPLVWEEARQGRLRQGWGSVPEGNLDVIAETRRLGGELTDEQRESWRARRMRTAEPDGVQVGDLVVALNLPTWGRLSVFRVAGSYRYEMLAPRQWGECLGHILPVELLLANVDRRSPLVSDALRALFNVQLRLYSIDSVGGDVEALLGNPVPDGGGAGGPEHAGEPWTEAEYEVLFGRFPPLGPRPTDDDVTALAAEFGRTFDAVRWQWEDGAAYCSGRSASTTSQVLMKWFDGK